jgi:hypothetical protein
MTPQQIEQWSANQFLDCSRNELSEVLKQAHAHPGRGAHSDETLRQLCCELIGVPYSPRAEVGAPPVSNDPPAPRVKLSASTNKRWFQHKPNLLCGPGWQGRRRRVKLHITERLREGTVAVFSVNNWTIAIQPGHEVSISYPHFEALKNTRTTGAKKEEQGINPATGIANFVYQEWSEFTYPFDDLGDDSETIDMPVSAIAWLQSEARRREYFVNEEKDTLVAILNFLTDNSIDRKQAREMTNTDLVEDVLMKISLLDEALAAEAA